MSERVVHPILSVGDVTLLGMDEEGLMVVSQLDHSLEVERDPTFVVTCMWAPLQIEGWVNGKHYYFRSRHGHWALYVPDYSLDTPPIAGDDGEPTLGEAVQIIYDKLGGL